MVGFFVWAVSFFLSIGESPETELIERIFLFGVLVVVPLGLQLVAYATDAEDYASIFKFAVLAQPLGAFAVLVSLLLPHGWLSALLSLGWLTVDLALAGFGGWRLLHRNGHSLENLSIDAALLYPLVGGASFVFYQLDLQPLGFGATIILLTAVHFHFAGFAAPILAAMNARFLKRRGVLPFWFRVAIVLVAGSMPIVAVGITLSPPIGLIGAVTISAGILLVGLASVSLVLPSFRSPLIRILLSVSALSSVAGMILAILYAYSIVTSTLILTIPAMAVTHGLLNSFGFATCGLLGWLLIESELP